MAYHKPPTLKKAVLRCACGHVSPYFFPGYPPAGQTFACLECGAPNVPEPVDEFPDRT